MADGSKTEQPTERRRKQARDKGQIARSREVPAALAIFAAVCFLGSRGLEDVAQWRRLFASLLSSGMGPGSIGVPVVRSAFGGAVAWAAGPLLLVWILALLSTVGQGGFVFASEALAFKAERLNPANKLKELASMRGVSNTLKSLVPFAFMVALGISQLQNAWPEILDLSAHSAQHACAFLGTQALALGWKLSLVMVVWSAADYLLQRQHMESQLKMSRDELKEEFKESEGNPQVKAKIRRLQRQLRRQQMLQAVKTASVVVTNPTHYALALEYRAEMAAPVLVAKGLNRFAEEIKQMAAWYEVPIVEDRPLAHALYRSVEVGEMIPAKLYRAVAEVLAAVYRAQAQIKRRT